MHVIVECNDAFDVVVAFSPQMRTIPARLLGQTLEHFSKTHFSDKFKEH